MFDSSVLKALLYNSKGSLMFSSFFRSLRPFSLVFYSYRNPFGSMMGNKKWPMLEEFYRFHRRFQSVSLFDIGAPLSPISC